MEELNQVQDELLVDSEDNENLFDDFEAEETTEATEETNETNETEAEEQVPASFLTIKFNGEEKSLSEDEARTLAQKGMNYDRFYEPLERLARMNGMNVGDYVNKLNDTQIAYEVSREVENLRNDAKYDGVSDEILEEIANAKVRENVSLQDKNYEEQRTKEADAETARVQREIDMFFEEYPEFKTKGPESLDPKVYEYVKKGYTLLEAYNKFQREQVNAQQMKAKEKTAKLNEENRKRSLGNTSNAGNVEADDFLNGFLNG